MQGSVQTEVNVPANPGEEVPGQMLVGVNFRSDAGLSKPIQRQLPLGRKVRFYPSTLKNADGWSWVFAHDQDGAPGWLARRDKTDLAPYLASIDPAAPLPPFRLPVRWAFTISSRFNAPRTYNDEPQLHEGIDVAPKGVLADGGLVRACLAGVVTQAGFDQDGYGHYLRVRHEWFDHVWATWYAHLASPAVVQVGQSVIADQPLGVVGSSGNSTGTHLHLTVQHIPLGLTGYVVANVVNPEGVIDFSSSGAPAEPEPPAKTGFITTFRSPATAALWQSFVRDSLAHFEVDAEVESL